VAGQHLSLIHHPRYIQLLRHGWRWVECSALSAEHM
jgi:hypothetical protein